MRLCKFEIKNFKGIEYDSFDWDDLIVLIGENNAGKSSVLQALEWFLSGSQIRDSTLFRDHVTDLDHAIELVGFFDQLSDEEQQQRAVSGRMFEDQWIIKKKYWFDTVANGARRSAPWEEQYYTYSVEERFTNWPDSDNAWGNFPPEYEGLIEQLQDRGNRPNNQTREALKDLVRQQNPDLIYFDEPDWKPNPGGGGNWKSIANSIIPRFLFVKAVHDAGDEAVSKEASTYGKIVELIVEKKFMRRREVIELKEKIEAVLDLFRPHPEDPERQAVEIKELQIRINSRLNEVIGGIASIETQEPDIRPILLPSTTLMIQDSEQAVKTPVTHQGHGLQRTLVMALLQILVEDQMAEQRDGEDQEQDSVGTRPVVLAIEEPELYMHPQMQRKMRDALYRLALQPRFQVICTTHSPVFLDMGGQHRRIVRVVKNANRDVALFQVSGELFAAEDDSEDRDRLRVVAEFHPTVNEVFFAKRVVLFEEASAVCAFERAAELTGLFDRHPQSRRDVTLINCEGNGNIPMFQLVLNHFHIQYTVIHDEDRGNASANVTNERIEHLLHSNSRHLVSPTDLEGLLGYVAAGRDKPYQAVKKVEELADVNSLPPDFMQALNWVYFGQDSEPQVSA